METTSGRLAASTFDPGNLTNTLTLNDGSITIERMFSPPVVDLATVTDDALSSHIQDCARWRGALDAFQACMLAEFESRQIARGRGFRDSIAWLSAATPTGEATARVLVQRAAILDVLPAFAAALAAGEISTDHLAGVIRAAGITGTDAVVTDEVLLAGWARTTNPKCFSRRVRRWVLQHPQTGETAAEATRATRSASVGVDAASGTGFLHAELPVDEHAIVTNALWGIVDEQWRAEKGADAPTPPHTVLTSQQRLADALVEMARRATGANMGGSSSPSRPLVTVLIGLDTLTGRLSHTGTPVFNGAAAHSGTADTPQAHLGGGSPGNSGVPAYTSPATTTGAPGIFGARLGDGTPIDASTVRRLACEADIIPVVLGGQSQPLDVGRSRRLATRAQRAAMLTRSATCEWPECTTPANWCQAHHLTPWETGGSTNLHNLMYACTAHHHLCHEGHWTVTRNNHGTISVTPPATNTSTTTPPTTSTSSTSPLPAERSGHHPVTTSHPPFTAGSRPQPPGQTPESATCPSSPPTDPPFGSRRPRRPTQPAHTTTTPSQPPPRRRTRAA